MASFISDHHYSDPEILVRKNNRSVTTLTLNRPRKLNALSVSMLSRLSELFLRYQHDPYVKLVILKANGKAFSPGGRRCVCSSSSLQWQFESCFQKFRNCIHLNVLGGNKDYTPGFISQWNDHGDRGRCFNTR
ncbi:hypothetical protein ABKV19_023380 [Rosa sericea]